MKKFIKLIMLSVCFLFSAQMSFATDDIAIRFYENKHEILKAKYSDDLAWLTAIYVVFFKYEKIPDADKDSYVKVGCEIYKQHNLERLVHFDDSKFNYSEQDSHDMLIFTGAEQASIEKYGKSKSILGLYNFMKNNCH